MGSYPRAGSAEPSTLEELQKPRTSVVASAANIAPCPDDADHSSRRSRSFFTKSCPRAPRSKEVDAPQHGAGPAQLLVAGLGISTIDGRHHVGIAVVVIDPLVNHVVGVRDARHEQKDDRR